MVNDLTKFIDNLNASVSIFPNPTNNSFSVESEKFNENTVIKIINEFSQIVYHSNLFSDKNLINIEQLSNGIYFLQIFENNKLIGVKKILKQ